MKQSHIKHSLEEEDLRELSIKCDLSFYCHKAGGEYKELRIVYYFILNYQILVCTR